MKFSNIEQALSRFFSPQIFCENLWLRALFYSLLAHSLLLFTSWRNAGILTTQALHEGDFSCWPYFQSCDIFYVFSDMPSGYSLGILYTVLGTAVALSFIYALRNRWTYALFFFFLITCFKFFVVYVSTYSLPTNYNEFTILISVIILFSHNTIYALKVCSTLFYYVALFNKFHTGYLTGHVFTSLSLGVPFVPSFLLSYFGIVFMSILLILPTLLWSSRAQVRFVAGVGLILFHLSTIAIVGFVYPLLCIPLVLLTMYTPLDTFSFKKIIRDRILLAVVLLMVLGQLFALMIPGDNRLTGEGTKFGFSMYDANHQCTGFLEHTKKNTVAQLFPYSNGMAMGICDPYRLWFASRTLCADPDTSRVSMYFKQSINGGRYYELVNEENICNKSYSLTHHNTWIHTDKKLNEFPSKNSFLISKTSS